MTACGVIFPDPDEPRDFTVATKEGAQELILGKVWRSKSVTTTMSLSKTLYPKPSNATDRCVCSSGSTRGRAGGVRLCRVGAFGAADRDEGNPTRR